MAVTVGGGLTALGACEAEDKPVERIEGYGPLVPMGALALPHGFSYKVISRQGDPMGDGNLTPGFFDGMGAFPGPNGSTVLIRNHENQRKAGEIPVIVGDVGKARVKESKETIGRDICNPKPRKAVS
jgi:uncharacterized protein